MGLDAIAILSLAWASTWRGNRASNISILASKLAIRAFMSLVSLIFKRKPS